MPVIHISVDVFNKQLGKVYTLEQLDKICFEFGAEITEEQQEIKLDNGEKKQQKYYAFELACNRPDLLCVEGLTLALGVFLGIKQQPEYKIVNLNQHREKIVVTKNVSQVRPYIVSCILRNISFTPESYQSFIDYQEKLHQTFCRRRRLVAIGTHDYDTIKGPFLYDARPPKEIQFVPLIGKSKDDKAKYDAAELMKIYDENLHLKEFLPLIRDSPVYPVIYDSNGVVCSLPPIINGDHSKIKMSTKNIFIEITALNYYRALQTLNLIVSAFSQYCGQPYCVEEVEIEYQSNNEVKILPNLEKKVFKTNVQYVNKLGSINIDTKTAASLCSKLQLEGKQINDLEIEVKVPICRTDIIQECDIGEDICIAYGYSNIIQRFPNSLTVGKYNLLNKMSDFVRQEMANAGFTEGLNFVLNNMADLTKKLRKEQDPLVCEIGNPRTEDFTVGRTTLIPGCLKWLSNNKHNKIPMQLFEVGDIVIKADNETCSKNSRNLCAIYTNNSSEIEILHGVLDQLMKKLNIPPPEHLQVCDQKLKDKREPYILKPSSDSVFLEGKQAQIMYKNQVVGKIGILHPEILDTYEWPYPISLFELNLEPLFDSV